MSARSGLVAFVALVVNACALVPSAAGAIAEDATLEPEWSAAAPDAPELLSADERGAVAIGGTGELVVVDGDGQEQWRRTLAADSAGAVAIGGDAVAVVDDEGLLVFDRVSGSERWQHGLTGVQSLVVGAGPEDETLVALVTDRGLVELLDGRTGSVRWSVAVPVGEKMFASRAWILDSRVMVVWHDETANLRVLDVASGAEIWGYEAPELFSMPAVADGVVAFAENIRLDRRGERVLVSMHGFALADGQELWSRSTRSALGYYSGIPAAGGDRGVAMVDFAGKVTVLEPQTGEVLWRRRTGLLQYEAEPHVLGGVFVLPTYGTGLLAATVAEGDPLEIDGIEPGQTAMTIQASAAAGDRLYLLVSFQWGDDEIWMLRASA